MMQVLLLLVVVLPTFCLGLNLDVIEDDCMLLCSQPYMYTAGSETECLKTCEAYIMQSYFASNALPFSPNTVESDNDLENLNEIMKKQKSAFVRIGREPDSKRPSSFVRIGRSAEKDDDVLDAYHAQMALKRPSSFVRIGKKDDEKRASHFVRIGKSAHDDEKRPSSFVRIGRGGSDVDTFPEAYKRTSSFVRIGKLKNYFPKRPSSFVRIGKRGGYEGDVDEKRQSSFLRIGEEDDREKRPSAFVRIGKSKLVVPAELYQQKRPSSFVRIGKKSTLSDGLPKRPSSFVRIGKSVFPEGNDLSQDGIIEQTGYNSPVEASELYAKQPSKRPSSFVRIGKRSIKSDKEN